MRAVKVVIMRNDRGQSMGNAMVEFSSSQDADYVIKSLNNTDLDGRMVTFKLQGGGAGGAGGYRGGMGRGQQ